MIRLAKVEEAGLVHQVMMEAFEEYRHIDIPSSALNETVDAIKKLLADNKEQALLYIEDGVPIGSVRLKLAENHLYFSRFSVCPEKQGKGIAKSMLLWLEAYACQHNKQEIRCQVRMSVPRNIYLYQSVGYEIDKEELVVKPNGSQVRTVFMKKDI